jgi:hypothetical protein
MRNILFLAQGFYTIEWTNLEGAHRTMISTEGYQGLGIEVLEWSREYMICWSISRL